MPKNRKAVAKVLSSKIVFHGDIFDVRKERVREPEGVLADRDVVTHPGSVVVMPVFPDGRILMIRQYRHSAKQYLWELVAGRKDPGETFLHGAHRELKEETGTDKARILAELDDWLSYDLPDEVAGRVWRGRFKGQTQKWFALAFTGTDADIDLTAHTPEFKAWRWMPLDAVARAIVAFKRPIYERVAREFAPIAARLAAESDGQKAD